ncbi:MAG TPA: hypothetical protein VEI02_11925 [Planctomycetota bacterium]|nr:hypothetical protein [Planctomycetota bacterium]
MTSFDLHGTRLFLSAVLGAACLVAQQPAEPKAPEAPTAPSAPKAAKKMKPARPEVRAEGKRVEIVEVDEGGAPKVKVFTSQGDADCEVRCETTDGKTRLFVNDREVELSELPAHGVKVFTVDGDRDVKVFTTEGRELEGFGHGDDHGVRIVRRRGQGGADADVKRRALKVDADGQGRVVIDAGDGETRVYRAGERGAGGLFTTKDGAKVYVDVKEQGDADGPGPRATLRRFLHDVDGSHDDHGVRVYRSGGGDLRLFGGREGWFPAEGGAHDGVKKSIESQVKRALKGATPSKRATVAPRASAPRGAPSEAALRSELDALRREVKELSSLVRELRAELDRSDR